MPREVWLIRGEGGAVTKMSPPFGEGIASRLRSGALVRVNADGSLWTAPEAAPADPADPAAAPATLAEQRVEQQLAEQQAETAIVPVPVPDKNARKGDWVKYASSTGQITAEAADNLSRAELIARFGG